MSKFSVPAAGIAIEHNPKGSNGPPQIIRLKLSEQDARDLIRHVREGGTSRFKTGRHLAIEYGTKRVAVRHGTNNHPQQVFAGPLDGSKPLYFSGKLSHSLEVLHAKEATAGTDSALEKLKNNLKQSQEERSSQQSAISGNKLLRPGHRPSPLSAGLLNSRPSSPFLSAGFSPRIGPTSAPLLSGQSQQEKIKLAAIKIPVIHLLAMEPQEPSRLAEKLRVRRTELDQVLMKVAKDGKGGKKELKDRSFKDLDVWKFPYPSQGDRQMAIDNAISAFDRQRVEKTDHLWQMLLAKEDRGKGIYLSKLNFDKPLNPGNLTPKIAERSTDGTSTEGKSMNSLGSGDSSKKGKAPVSKSTDKPKLTAHQIAKNLKKIGNREAAIHSGRNIPVVKETAAKKTQSTKQDPKVKSSEKVVDSDEEADAGPSIAAPVTKRKDTGQPKPLRPQKPPLHKVLPSKSPSGSGDADRGRLIYAPAMVRTRGGKDTDNRESSKLSSAPQSRNPSRPRNGSSPAKPSPLGSSPPANTRDVDTSSNSSKGTMLSSAPSSPPSTADSSHGKKTYSPIVSAKKTERLTNGIKRKAETHDSTPPAKKQQPQMNGANSRNDTSRLHGLPDLPASLNNVIDRRQTTKRESPDSDASSVSEKSLTKEQIIEEAKRFHKYYAKYKELHEKVNKQKSSERKDEDIDLVWSMHKRLSDMKDKIWKDWERVEKAKT